MTAVVSRTVTTVASLGASVRVQKSTGSTSVAYLTASAGSVNGVNLVQLNNLRPSVSIGTVTYPASQQALKNVETATVANTASNHNTIAYSSPGSELTVTNPTAWEANKVVTRLGGTYNIATNNLTITAVRTANNSTTSASACVKIAHTFPTIDISVPYARLRSNTTNTDYAVTISSDQNLAAAPSLTVPAGGGTLPSANFSGSLRTWTRALRITDATVKTDYTFTGLSATTVINSGAGYNIGGFIRRTIIIPSIFPDGNRQMLIGTIVVNTAKLSCTNLSIAGCVSGVNNFDYKATTTSEIGHYTILNGDTWYNCDDDNSEMNVSGTLSIEIEETV
jgi:hypothetical protein